MYNIIYEDNWLMIIDKPSGMLVIPTPKGEKNTLTDELNRELDRRGIEENAHPCHRLDRETSGLIIYAKGKKIQGLMMEEFRKKTVKKTYVAFVHGLVKKNFDIIKSGIYNRNKKRLESAVTKYKVLGRRGNFSILEVEPVTGRTNQIRIHLKAIGHPIVGESVYAFRKDFKLRFRRTALHAGAMEFTHPVTKEKMRFESPLAPDMKNFLNKEK
ncbi:MAG: RluA family pseudouridine synthase [Candidatus Omnitrophota bacterium]